MNDAHMLYTIRNGHIPNNEIKAIIFSNTRMEYDHLHHPLNWRDASLQKKMLCQIGHHWNIGRVTCSIVCTSVYVPRSMGQMQWNRMKLSDTIWCSQLCYHFIRAYKCECMYSIVKYKTIKCVCVCVWIVSKGYTTH